MPGLWTEAKLWVQTMQYACRDRFTHNIPWSKQNYFKFKKSFFEYSQEKGPIKCLITEKSLLQHSIFVILVHKEAWFAVSWPISNAAASGYMLKQVLLYQPTTKRSCSLPLLQTKHTEISLFSTRLILYAAEPGKK